jgi:hypothetical protein
VRCSPSSSISNVVYCGTQGLAQAEAEEETDEQVTRRAFEGIANGKQHVSLKDMLNWDFVYTLLAEVSFCTHPAYGLLYLSLL